MQTRKPDKLPHIFFMSSSGFEIGNVRQPFNLRGNIGELLELGARKLLVLSGTRSILHPYLDTKMYFIMLGKGDLFLKLFHHLCNGPGLIPAQFSDISVHLRRNR
jgi:hypothetical protein